MPLGCCLSRTAGNLRVIPQVKNAFANPSDWMLRYKQPVAITYISLTYTRTHASEHLRSDSPLEATTLPTRENSNVVLSLSLPTHHHHYTHPQHPYTHFKRTLHTLAAPHTGMVNAFCIHSTQTHTLNALPADHIWTSLVVLVSLVGCFLFISFECFVLPKNHRPSIFGSPCVDYEFECFNLNTNYFP